DAEHVGVALADQILGHREGFAADDRLDRDARGDVPEQRQLDSAPAEARRDELDGAAAVPRPLDEALFLQVGQVLVDRGERRQAEAAADFLEARRVAVLLDEIVEIVEDFPLTLGQWQHARHYTQKKSESTGFLGRGRINFAWRNGSNLVRMLTRALSWTAKEPGCKVTVANETDAELVQRCLAGRRDAFDMLVERQQRHVYQLCYRFAGNHEDANDLAQEVFIRAYRGLKTFKGQATLGTWLYRIGVNVCLNRVSVKSRREALDPLIEASDERTASQAESAADALLRGERAAQVRAAIAKLPRKQRATLVLRVYHDLPHDQIAGILGSSVGAVKANFFHALNNLKKL